MVEREKSYAVEVRKVKNIKRVNVIAYRPVENMYSNEEAESEKAKNFSIKYNSCEGIQHNKIINILKLISILSIIGLLYSSKFIIVAIFSMCLGLLYNNPDSIKSYVENSGISKITEKVKKFFISIWKKLKPIFEFIWTILVFLYYISIGFLVLIVIIAVSCFFIGSLFALLSGL